VRERVKEIARKRQRFGHLRITALLRREGMRVNHKRIHRIGREEGLLVPRYLRKRLKREVVQLEPAVRLNQRWAMNFVQDALAGSRKLRIFTVEGTYSREGLALVLDTLISGLRVRRELNRIARERGDPEEIRIDNGADSSAGRSRAGTKSITYCSGRSSRASRIRTDLSSRSTAGCGDECLNATWFWSLPDAREKIEAWRRGYNEAGHTVRSDT
jgi:putative transposase